MATRQAQNAYNEAMKSFNRSAGQFKRKHDIDPSEYLNGVTTAKGVERALDKMRLDVEQMDRQFREDLSAEAEAAEEAAKAADLKAKEDQYQQARDTLEEKWGISMDETESEIFWNAFNDPDIIDAFGSKNVLYMGEEIRNDKQITMKQAAEIAKGVSAEVVGKSGEDKNQTARNTFNERLESYRSLRYGEGDRISHDEAIKRIFG